MPEPIADSIRNGLFGICLLVAAVPGCTSSSGHGQRLKFTNLGLHRKTLGVGQVAGGTPKQRSLARFLMASIDGKAISSVTIGPPPRGMRPAPSEGLYGHTWLTIHVRAAGSEPVADLAATWKMALLAGAYRDAAKAGGLATVLGYNGLIEYPVDRSPLGDSKPREEGSAISGAFAHDVLAESPEALAAHIRREFERIAETASITHVTVSFIKPTNLAVIVDVRSIEPSRVLRKVSFLRSLRSEGLLLRIWTADGRPFAVRTLATRAHTGGSWG